MLYRLWRTISKELLLLYRDLGGLVIIFLMPLLLIITITLIQDSTFKNFEDTKIPVIVINHDQGEVSKKIVQEIKNSKTFSVVTKNKKADFSEATAKQAVFNGDYQMAIIIPKNLSADLDANTNAKVEEIVASLGYVPVTDSAKTVQPALATKREINLYFDPATNLSFKNSVKNAIDKMVYQIENQKIYAAFQAQLGTEAGAIDQSSFIAFKEITPAAHKEVKPNSVQHNVPAWALFAIFFIVVPLSINLVKEKNQGTVIRLFTSPTPYIIHILGKTLTYLLICIIQFLLMVAVGVFLFPYLGLTKLDVTGKMPLMLFVTFFAALAAIGFGILLGTLAKTQEQSAPFGATSVVVLAAIGGIWVPVFLMPTFMQSVAKFSPLNWGLSAYYDILLRNSGISAVLPEAALLLHFYVITVTISLIYDKRKKEL